MPKSLRSYFHCLALFPLISCYPTGWLAAAELVPAPHECGSSCKDLAAVSQDYWDTMLRLSPLDATENNVPGYNDKLADISPKGREEMRRELLRLIDSASSIDRASLAPRDQDTLDMLQFNLHRRLEELEIGFYRWDVDHLYGPQTELPRALRDNQPTKTAKDAQDYLARLNAIRPYLRDHVANLKEGLAMSQTAARRPVERTISILDDLLKISAEDSAFAAVGKSFPAPLQEEYLPQFLAALNQVVYPAFAEYRDFLKNEYLDHARTDDKPGLVYMPGGKEIYEFAIKYHTTLDKPAIEIHAMGLEDLEKIHAEIGSIASRAGFQDIRKFEEAMTNDPKNFFSDPSDIEKTANDLINAAREKLPQYFNSTPKTPLEVRPVEAFRAKNAIAGAYNGPPADLSRPGIFYVNTYNPGIRARYNLPALTAHEALPGHHMQIATQAELEDLPVFRRQEGPTAFTEGWGLYAERLADEMGLYKDDSARFGMLTLQAFRAARLVVDTGLHALGWTRQQAIDFMVSNVPMKEDELAQEVDRYLSSTTGGHIRAGQALAYKMGQTEIESIRKEAETELGNRFDIRKFHDAVLKSGSVPLPILRRIVRRELEIPDKN